MKNYFNLPQFQAPGAVDLSPIHNALNTYQKTNYQNALMARQDEEQTYQRARDAKQDARQDEEFRFKFAEAMAKRADAFSRLPPEQQTQGGWDRLVANHRRVFPNDQLEPEDLDYRTGPARYAAAFGGITRDPREEKMKDLDLQYKQAQIGKLNAEAAKPMGGEAPSNVREWEYFSKLTPEQQIQYLAMKRAEKYLDTGTSYSRPNPIEPGQTVSTVPKDVAGAAREKELGEAKGKAIADLPRITDNANRALATIQQIRSHPGKGAGTGVAGVLPGIPGTEQRGFVNLVDQAKGQTFLEAFNSLRGGGQITEAEGAKATQALARLDRAQTPGDFEQALKDLEDVVAIGLSRAQGAAAGVPQPQPGTAQPDARSILKQKYNVDLE